MAPSEPSCGASEAKINGYFYLWERFEAASSRPTGLFPSGREAGITWLTSALGNRVALRGLRGGGRSPTKLVSGAKFPVFGHDQGIISLAAASSGLTNQKKSMIVKALAMSWKRRQANTAEIKQGIGLK
jgi:hypothetical protein